MERTKRASKAPSRYIVESEKQPEKQPRKQPQKRNSQWFSIFCNLFHLP